MALVPMLAWSELMWLSAVCTSILVTASVVWAGKES